jgi:hypothetical protein
MLETVNPFLFLFFFVNIVRQWGIGEIGRHVSLRIQRVTPGKTAGGLVKLADTYDLGSYEATRAGSSPVSSTIQAIFEGFALPVQ